jgi:hypothetical protein
MTLASDDTSSIDSATGAVSLSIAKGSGGGGAVGIGVSIAFNDIANTVRASVDASTVSSAQSAILTADSKATINALSVAGSLSGAGGDGGGFAFSGDGAGSINLIANTVAAEIVNGSSLTVGGPVTLAASDDSSLNVATGTAALSFAGGSGGGAAAGLGVSVAVNDIGNTLRAAIDSSDVDAGGDITINAVSSADIQTLTVSGAISGAGGSGGGLAFSGAGAVSVNTITNTVAAEIIASSVDTSLGGLSLKAEDISVISAIAGTASISGGGGSGGGVSGQGGASFANNVISNDVRARVDGANVDVPGAIMLDANSGATITAITIGFSAGGSGGSGGGINLSVAGSGSVNVIANSVDATIRNASTVDTDSTLTLRARDTSVITGLAGGASGGGAGGAAGGGAGAVGASFAVNDITNSLNAGTNNATITTGGAIDITAEEAAVITSVTIGFAGSGAGGSGGGVAISAAGAGSVNVIGNTVAAEIKGGSVNAMAGGLTLTARDVSVINAIAGGGAISGGGGAGGGISGQGGASFATNVIANSIGARIDAATVNVTGPVLLEAEEAAVLTAVTIGFAGGGSGGAGGGVNLSVAGSGSVNVIANTVEATIIGGATVETDSTLTLRASDVSVITGLAGGAAIGGAGGAGGGGAGAVGASFAVNDITNTIPVARSTSVPKKRR